MSDQDTLIAEALAETRGRRARKPDDEAPEYLEVTIDLPPHAQDVRIDGRVFQNGMTYKVKTSQAASLRDIMGRAWQHEQEVRGERTGFGPRRYNGARI